MDDMARSDRIAANDGKPLEFRTVEAVSLVTLLGETGVVDFLHSDIQGAEETVFPAGMDALNQAVKLCCVTTHGRAIEEKLVETFSTNGWVFHGGYQCELYPADPNRVVKDGVFVWSNPRLTSYSV